MNASDWKPIETAPKDGTRVLLWVGMDGAFHLATVGKWMERIGWVSHCVHVEPTHWMGIVGPENQKS